MSKRTNTATWIAARNRWQINVQKDGRRKTFTSSTPGRTGQREANAKADAWLDDNIDNTNIRVNQLIAQYLDSLKQKTSCEHYTNTKRLCDQYLSPEIGNKKISSLTEQDLQSIIDKAFKKTNKKGDTYYLSKKSLQNIRAMIMNFLKFCRKKKATTLFLEDLVIPKAARCKQKKILSPSDISALFTVDTTLLRNCRVFDDYIYAYRFAVLTGLRPGELRGIKKEDVIGRTLKISRSINIYNEITNGKNDNALRLIHLSDLSYAVLQNQLDLHQNAEYLFNINSTSTFLHRWKRYCESNDITPTSLYELRHTFVSVAKLLPEGQVKQLVGHSKDMDTFGIYSHEMSGDGERTANDLNSIFDKILSQKRV